MGPQRDIFRFVTHFWYTVERRDAAECWPWSGARNSRGYGSLGWRNPDDGIKYPLIAHRVAYHLVNGAIPVGMVVMHTCDNPPCCNPSHLRLGTVADNNRDRSLKGRTARPGVGNWNHNRRRSDMRGEKHPLARIGEDAVRHIRALCAEGRLTQRQIGQMYGISQSAVMAINTRRTWAHVE